MRIQAAGIGLSWPPSAHKAGSTALPQRVCQMAGLSRPKPWLARLFCQHSRESNNKARADLRESQQYRGPSHHSLPGHSAPGPPGAGKGAVGRACRADECSTLESGLTLARTVTPPCGHTSSPHPVRRWNLNISRIGHRVGRAAPATASMLHAGRSTHRGLTSSRAREWRETHLGLNSIIMPADIMTE